MQSDEAEIASIVRTFFEAFASGDGLSSRMARLRELFLPNARIVKTCGDLTSYDVEGFIAPRAELLSGDVLTDFSEWQESGRTDIWGDIAQHWCSYAKKGVQDGVPFTGRGMKTLQFARTQDGWRIASVLWDDER